jgi:hypothetical protein
MHTLLLLLLRLLACRQQPRRMRCAFVYPATAAMTAATLYVMHEVLQNYEQYQQQQQQQ